MRILVFGNVNGKFDALFSKLETIISKNGKFDLCIILGNFFGENFNEENWSQFSAKTKAFPLPTCALSPYNSRVNNFFQFNLKGSEVLPNLLILNNHGIYKEASGLTIAYISDFNDESKKFADSVHEKIAFELLSKKKQSNNKPQQNKIDILITNCSPCYINNEAGDSFQNKFKNICSTSKNLSILAKQLKPRYHFCAAEVFAERNPFRNHVLLKEKAAFPTRFFFIANFGSNKTSEKSCYAFNIEPMSSMSEQSMLQEISRQLDLSGDNPYPEIAIKISTPLKKQYFFDETSNNANCHSPKSSKIDKNDQSQRQQKCWFCLSNPDIEHYLICMTLKHAYLVIPKGSVDDFHLLICPNTHLQCQTCFNEDTLYDVEILKDFVRQMYSKHNLFPVFAERNYSTFHSNIECFGLTQSQIDKLEWLVVKELSKLNIDYDELPSNISLKNYFANNKPYYMIEFNDSIFITKTPLKNFQLNFTRQLMCSSRILNQQSKLNWKDCIQSKQDALNIVAQVQQDLQDIK